MITVISEGKVEVGLSPVQRITVESVSPTTLLGILDKIKFTRVLLVVGGGGASEVIENLGKMLKEMRRSHAILLVDGGIALMGAVVFNSTFFRTCVRLLSEIGWNRIDGLVRGLGKIAFLPKRALATGEDVRFTVKPGKMPERLTMFVSHLFWQGAYGELVGERTGSKATLLKAARAFEHEAGLYVAKGVANIAERALMDALRIYEKLGAEERVARLRSRITELVEAMRGGADSRDW